MTTSHLSNSEHSSQTIPHQQNLTSLSTPSSSSSSSSNTSPDLDDPNLTPTASNPRTNPSGFRSHRRLGSNLTFSSLTANQLNAANQSTSQLRNYLASPASSTGYFSEHHSNLERRPLLSSRHHPQYDSVYSNSPQGPHHTSQRSDLRNRARPSHPVSRTWSQSLRIPDWVSIYSQSNEPTQSTNCTRLSENRTSRVDRKGGYDAEFKTELAGQSGNGMRVWYSTYTSVDWLHELVKESIRRKKLNRIRGLRGKLKRFWDKSQGWVLVTLIGIFTALMAGLIVSLEMWLFDLKEGYCATRWRSPKRFCCGSHAETVASIHTLNATATPQYFFQQFKLLPFDGFSTNPVTRGSPFTPSSFIHQWSTPDFSTTHKCQDWILWTDLFSKQTSSPNTPVWKSFVEFAVYLFIALIFAGLSSTMTVYLSSSESVQSAKDRVSDLGSIPAQSALPSDPSHPTDAINGNLAHGQYMNQNSPDCGLLNPCLHSVESADPNPLLPPSRPRFSTQSSYSSSRQETLTAPNQVDSTKLSAVTPRAKKVAYFAAGSGIPEIKCILSGFVIRGYLGTSTMLTKSFGLALSVASGLSLGKEGPLVHIASCIGNIFTRCFTKFDRNEGKRREVLSAACAAGVSVAFGAPIGGVLFSLEEVSYFFPPRVMWRSCWAAMVAAATLRVLDPFKTGKTVLFEVTYDRQWHFFEFAGFVLLGVLGGILGAWFAQANVWWTKNVRKATWLNHHPIAEVLLVTGVTVLLGFSNRFLKMGGSELVFEMLAECSDQSKSSAPCITDPSQTAGLIITLASAAALKFLTTIVTFGIKCPAGIFIPSLAIGALLGRILGLAVEYAFYAYPHLGFFSTCAAAVADGEAIGGFGKVCVLPAVWSMVGAAAMLAGVTRSTVSLAVIVMELTGSLVYILPIAISVLVAKTTADAIESRSIYDLVIEASDLPYLDAKSEYIHTAMPGDIMDQEALVICVEDELTVSELETRAGDLLRSSSGEGFPLVSRDEAGERIVGYIGRAELEHGLELIPNSLLSSDPVVVFEAEGELEAEETDEEPISEERGGLRGRRRNNDQDQDEQVVNLSHLVDHAPVAVSVKSPMELLHEIFVRLGVRYLVIQDERGLYLGIIERNRWLRYLSWVEHRARLSSSSSSSNKYSWISSDSFFGK